MITQQLLFNDSTSTANSNSMPTNNFNLSHDDLFPNTPAPFSCLNPTHYLTNNRRAKNSIEGVGRERTTTDRIILCQNTFPSFSPPINYPPTSIHSFNVFVCVCVKVFSLSIVVYYLITHLKHHKTSFFFHFH